MSDLLKRIANYFANEYDGDDKTAPKMELSVDELRYIVSMHVDRCRAEAELRELKNKKYSRTNADNIRAMSDEELAKENIYFVSALNAKEGLRYTGLDGHYYRTAEEVAEANMKWLQSEVEE